jgi:hypothetical protein
VSRYPSFTNIQPDTENSVYRVEWLRARAAYNRWTEELLITRYEMQWTTKYYMHMAVTWGRRRDMAGAPQGSGLVAYAEKQITLWNELGRVAEAIFHKTDSKYVPLWQPVEHLPNAVTGSV